MSTASVRRATHREFHQHSRISSRGEHLLEVVDESLAGDGAFDNVDFQFDSTTDGKAASTGAAAVASAAVEAVSAIAMLLIGPKGVCT